jgi:hypothetical protein
MLIKEVPSSYKELLGLFRESKNQALRTLYSLPARRSYNEGTHPHYCVGCRNPYTDKYFWIETQFPRKNSNASIKISQVPVIFEADTSSVDHLTYFIRLGQDWESDVNKVQRVAELVFVTETTTRGHPHQRCYFELDEAYRLWMRFCTLP